MKINKESGGRCEARGASCACFAFTLLEVMVALAIFFTCAFAILQLVSGTLRNARALQQNEPDPAMLAAEASLATTMAEGEASGDFGKLYPGYHWSVETNSITNGLFQVECTISHHVGRNEVESHLSALFFRPNSPQTGMGKGVLQ